MIPRPTSVRTTIVRSIVFLFRGHRKNDAFLLTPLWCAFKCKYSLSPLVPMSYGIGNFLGPEKINITFHAKRRVNGSTRKRTLSNPAAPCTNGDEPGNRLNGKVANVVRFTNNGSR